jgi:iron(III) transport system substrate-binding protein
MLISVNMLWQGRQFLKTWISLGWLAVFIGCVPRSENEVVLYCSTDRYFAEPILDAFERRDGHPKVARQFDVETSKTLGLATRIMEEKAIPKCDVFWSGEILHTIRMQRAGVLESKNWRLPPDWPKSYVASDGSWVALGARARVILINKEVISNESDWPASVGELSDAKWKGKCGMAQPHYGTTATHMTTLATVGLKQHFKSDGFESWLTQVKENAVILGGNKQVATAVATGELAWGLTDSDDAQIEIDAGAPVAIMYPDQGEGQAGCLLIPGTVAIIKNGPHRIGAGLLADFLSSAETERRLTLGNAAQFALWPNNDKSIAKQATTLKTMEIDFEKVAMKWNDVFAILERLFR